MEEKKKTPIREICDEFGYTLSGLSKKFGIPLRSLEDWSSGAHQPQKYVVAMMRTILEHEREKK